MLFAARPTSLLDGLIIMGVGAALFVILEFEKIARRWLRRSQAA